MKTPNLLLAKKGTGCSLGHILAPWSQGQLGCMKNHIVKSHLQESHICLSWWERTRETFTMNSTYGAHRIAVYLLLWEHQSSVLITTSVLHQILELSHLITESGTRWPTLPFPSPVGPGYHHLLCVSEFYVLFCLKSLVLAALHSMCDVSPVTRNWIYAPGSGSSES